MDYETDLTYTFPSEDGRDYAEEAAQARYIREEQRAEMVEDEPLVLRDEQLDITLAELRVIRDALYCLIEDSERIEQAPPSDGYTRGDIVRAQNRGRIAEELLDRLPDTPAQHWL